MMTAELPTLLRVLIIGPQVEILFVASTVTVIKIPRIFFGKGMAVCEIGTTEADSSAVNGVLAEIAAAGLGAGVIDIELIRSVLNNDSLTTCTELSGWMAGMIKASRVKEVLSLKMCKGTLL